MPVSTWELVEDETLAVPQNEYDVPVGIEAEDGDRVEVSADGQIWCGLILFGKNGPEGFHNTPNDSKFPMPNARAFGLLVKVGDKYSYVGRHRKLTVRTGGEIFLRINDDDPTTGNGEFNAHVRVWRRA